MSRMVKKQKHTILLGEGIHQHTMYGDILVEQEPKRFSAIVVNKDGLLRHEKPNGSFGEHKGLQVDKGQWVMGLQVEYNPFKMHISQVFD